MAMTWAAGSPWESGVFDLAGDQVTLINDALADGYITHSSVTTGLVPVYDSGDDLTTVVVAQQGDLNGDGQVGSADLDIVRAAPLGEQVPAGVWSSGDVSGRWYWSAAPIWTSSARIGETSRRPRYRSRRRSSFCLPRWEWPSRGDSDASATGVESKCTLSGRPPLVEGRPFFRLWDHDESIPRSPSPCHDVRLFPTRRLRREPRFRPSGRSRC